MQKRNKFIVGFSAIVLTGTLAFGGLASAAGNENGDGNGRTKLTTEEKCDKIDDVEARVAEIQAKISERTTSLQEQRSEAEANGRGVRVERIDRRLERLEQFSTRLSERLTKVETWAATNCAA